MARLRLAVDVGRWDPSPREFDFLCSLLPDSEAEECRKFKFFDDQKRALVSRLLQRHVATVALGIPFQAVVIKRTKGRKPYIANEGVDRSPCPNFNYSVSHEGSFVVLASEDICVCGCDVAAPQQLRRSAGQRLADVLAAFTKQLTHKEWSIIRQHTNNDDALESSFRQFWSLKEAYAKATGEGLGFDLGRCEFTIDQGSMAAVVAVDGVHQPLWKFHLHQMGQGHWVAVGRGPISCIVDAWGGFTSTLQCPSVPEHRHQAALAAPEPPFAMLTVCDMIPNCHKDAYEAAGGEIY